jgi:carboxypeptidase PM20D1
VTRTGTGPPGSTGRIDARPFPARVDDVVLAMVDAVGRTAAPVHRALFAHAPLLRPLLAAVLSRAGREANACGRCTRTPSSRPP